MGEIAILIDGEIFYELLYSALLLFKVICVMFDNNEAPCEPRYCEITKEALPLSCPMADESSWDVHPRIYLPIEETGRKMCPYCGTTYILKKFNE